MDGLVLLNPYLHVKAFGVKINAVKPVAVVFDGASYAKKGRKAIMRDISVLGTRHGSILHYCNCDRDAIGIVVSQDGHVRIVHSVNKDLVMWDDVKLLCHLDFNTSTVRSTRSFQKYKKTARGESRMGYTDTPKDLAELLECDNV